MIGRLECSLPDRRSFELPTEPVTLGGGEGDALQLPGLPRELIRLTWDSGSATWRIALGAGAREGSVNGVPLSESKRPPLLDGYRIRVGSFAAVFRRELARPRVMNEELDEINLGKTGLVFGRGPAGANEGEEKVDLDAQDNRVSKRHAILSFENGDYFLADEGRFLPTVLNERTFEKERLVYGDRFRVGDYLFEYTGRTIRRVDQIRTGEVLAREVKFVVDDRPEPLRSAFLDTLYGLSGLRWLSSKLKPSKRTILQGISLAIKPGEFVGVLGGSGQGKSTLLNALCGINPATSGEVLINGVPLTDRKKMRELGIGYVPQDDIVHRELTVEQAVNYSAKLRLKLGRAETSALVDGVIRRMGLQEHRYKRVSKLSGGQRKRVSIAIELLAKPTILFLDEPSSGLDPATEEDLMNLLQKLAKTGLTVVCTTHVLQLAHLFDRLLVIHGGRLVFSGSADEARRLFLEREVTREVTGGTLGGRTSLAPLQRVYSALLMGGKTAEDWERDFLQSDVSQGHLEAMRQAEQNRDDPAVKAVKNQKQPRVGYLRTLFLLIARQAKILLADPLNVIFLVAQALMIGVLVGWVTDDVSLRLFLGMIATMWFGCSNGAQQIVSELPIFRRERVCGQGINVYLHSKVIFLSAITMVQSLALLLTIQGTAVIMHPPLTSHHAVWDELVSRRYPEPDTAQEKADQQEMEQMYQDMVREAKANNEPVPPMPTELLAKQKKASAAANRPSNFLIGALTNVAWFFDLRKNLVDSGPETTELGIEKKGIPVSVVLVNSLGMKLLSLLLAALVGVMLGLAVSAVVQTATQAAMWVPLILIPQILFGGYVVHAPEMTKGVRIFSGFLPSYAAQQIMDVGSLYGQAATKTTNRTKIAVFIDNVEAGPEEIKWTDMSGKKFTQTFDRRSLFNSAWQNMIIKLDQAGHWKPKEEDMDGGLKVKPDSVDERTDVSLRQNALFLNVWPVYYNIQILGGWAGLCYVLIVVFLAAKQTGK